jgi:DNA-binding transcriptional ArsR family regulator
MLDAREQLLSAIGWPAVEAVRALDAGQAPETVLLRYREATLPASLRQVLAAARRAGKITTDDLRAADDGLSPSAASNKLAKLELLGLLRREEEEFLRRGGRRFIYRPWDGEGA